MEITVLLRHLTFHNLKKYNLLNVNNEGLLDVVSDFEKDTGLILELDDLLPEIVNCLQYKNTVNLELDLYCLDLADKHCHGAIYNEFNDTLKVLQKIGYLIYKNFLLHELYKNNELNLIYHKRLNDNIILIDKGAIKNEIYRTRY